MNEKMAESYLIFTSVVLFIYKHYNLPVTTYRNTHSLSTGKLFIKHI